MWAKGKEVDRIRRERKNEREREIIRNGTRFFDG